MLKRRRSFFYQKSSMDCGLTCLRMICKYHGKNISLKTLINISEVESVGVSMAGIKKSAELLGFDAKGFRLQTLENLRLVKNKAPFIVHWNRNHFVVVFLIKKNKIIIGDPSRGIVKVNYDEFYRRAFRPNTINSEKPEAHILHLIPTSEFHNLKHDSLNNKPKLDFMLAHLKDKRIYFVVILFGLLGVMVIQFLMPFITKNVVDVGIKNGDLQMIKYLLIGQVVLIFSKAIFEVLRSYIVQHLSVRINYSLIANFLNKLYRLPVTFFEKRKIGDLLQRIRDHQRLEKFITKTILNVIISSLTLIVFSIVLFMFNKWFFLLFSIATILYVSWIFLFLNARKKVDWERFEVNSYNQTILVQMVNGIQDLKIYGAYKFLFNKWSKNQNDYIKTSFKSLYINQIQETGASFIYQMAQIIILYYSAKLILTNQLTLGAMLSIEFIIGQLVSPVKQILLSVIFGVEAKLSFERIFELWDTQEEKSYNQRGIGQFRQKIEFNNVSFKHDGQGSNFMLNNIDLQISKGETIAIVGSSGSGKTTILKLLLGYYMNYNGSIMIDGIELKDLNIEQWRFKCGTVLQENFVFSDTIANNITMGDKVDMERLNIAMEVSEIKGYVEGLPLKHNTIIGKDGKGLSQGQKQRILIARAVYRDPDVLFLDEATNALDAETESKIMKHLKSIASQKTVIIIAHRLSTVQFADKIYVFENGQIHEAGNHKELLKEEGKYHSLIQRQLYNNDMSYEIS